LHEKIKRGEGESAGVGADPEDKDEHKAENAFFVPRKARWSFPQSKAFMAPALSRNYTITGSSRNETISIL